jgi:hypothetical protein
VVLTGADNQVQYAVAIDIAHRDIDAAFKTGERNDGADEPVAVAIIQTNLGRFTGPAEATGAERVAQVRFMHEMP